MSQPPHRQRLPPPKRKRLPPPKRQLQRATSWVVREIKFRLREVVTSSPPLALASPDTGCSWSGGRRGRLWRSARRESARRRLGSGGSHLAPALAMPHFEQASTRVRGGRAS